MDTCLQLELHKHTKLLYTHAHAHTHVYNVCAHTSNANVCLGYIGSMDEGNRKMAVGHSNSSYS